jgi:two-component system OmpR family response regulator
MVPHRETGACCPLHAVHSHLRNVAVDARLAKIKVCLTSDGVALNAYLKDLSCCTAAHLRYCGFAFLAPASITPAMQTMAKILTIEDDRIVGRDIVDTLCDAGFEVEWVLSGQDGIARAVHDEFDVITLDRVLPGIDGLTILKTIRGVGIETPVLMISALSDVDERVRGLLAGGDDYIPKPFSAEEMKARIEVLLRRRGRRQQAASTVLRVDDLEIDLIARTATRGEHVVALPPVEFKLLEYFARNSGQILTRTMIFQSVWDMHFDPGTNLIEVYVGLLRRKIDLAGMRPLLKTVRGSGYMLG